MEKGIFGQNIYFKQSWTICGSGIVVSTLAPLSYGRGF